MRIARRHRRAESKLPAARAAPPAAARRSRGRTAARCSPSARTDCAQDRLCPDSGWSRPRCCRRSMCRSRRPAGCGRVLLPATGRTNEQMVAADQPPVAAFGRQRDAIGAGAATRPGCGTRANACQPQPSTEHWSGVSCHRALKPSTLDTGVSTPPSRTMSSRKRCAVELTSSVTVSPG